MNLILLSGGSGKRLWPLSNETRSKQFLKLVHGGPDGPESMLQRVHRQIREAGIDARIVVATGRAQVDPIRNQLGDAVDIVVEPERRDTFPAIALSVCHLALERGLGPDEIVVVLPVDPYADITFFTSLLRLEALVRERAARIALLGIRPTYPSSKYGYIVPAAGAGADDAARGSASAPPIPVARFTEKPSEEQAAELIAGGALWNAGVFAFRLGTVLDAVRAHLPFATYEDVLAGYGTLPKTSFDYAVVEREPDLVAVAYAGEWKDIGTWNTLTEVMEGPSSGLALLGEGCEGTHVVNELGIPVLVLGARGLIVAASPDGILVADKDGSARMKPYVDRLQADPRFEERRWGEFTVLEKVVFEDRVHALTKRFHVRAGASTGWHAHPDRDEILTVVDGEGTVQLGATSRLVARGVSATVPRGTRHQVHAKTDLHYVSVQIGVDGSEEVAEPED